MKDPKVGLTMSHSMSASDLDSGFFSSAAISQTGSTNKISVPDATDSSNLSGRDDTNNGEKTPD